MQAVFNLVFGIIIFIVVGAMLHRLAAYIGSKHCIFSKLNILIVSFIKKLCNLKS